MTNSSTVAGQINSLDRNQNLEKENDRIFHNTVSHGGIRWPQVPRGERTKPGVRTMDQSFDVKKKLQILEDNARVTQLRSKVRRKITHVHRRMSTILYIYIYLECTPTRLDWSELDLGERLTVRGGHYRCVQSAMALVGRWRPWISSW